MNHGAEQAIAEGRGPEITAGTPRQAAPEPAVGEFHRRAGCGRLIEEFDGERAELHGAAQAAAVAGLALGRFSRRTLYPICRLSRGALSGQHRRPERVGKAQSPAAAIGLTRVARSARKLDQPAQLAPAQLAQRAGGAASAVAV